MHVAVLLCFDSHTMISNLQTFISVKRNTSSPWAMLVPREVVRSPTYIQYEIPPWLRLWSDSGSLWAGSALLMWYNGEDWNVFLGLVRRVTSTNCSFYHVKYTYIDTNLFCYIVTYCCVTRLLKLPGIHYIRLSLESFNLGGWSLLGQ